MAVIGQYGVDYAHVTVYSSFVLDADKTIVRYGDVVRFTPKYDGVPGPATRWEWIPDDTSSHDALACAGGVVNCLKNVYGSGTMRAYATNGEVATKHILILCTVGDDPILDSTSVRIGFDSAYQASHPDSTDLKQIENAGYVIRNPNGTLSVIPLKFDQPLDRRGPCSWSAEMPLRADIVAFYHSHGGVKPYQLMRCLPYPDSTGLFPDTATYLPYQNGGGSGFDWSQLENYLNLQRKNAGLPTIPMYVIDGLNWYRLDANIPWRQGPSHLKFWRKRPLSCN